MSESALQQGLNEQAYYLFFDPTGGHDQSPSTVFYKVTDEAIAQGLCELFKEVFGQENSVAAFHNVAAKSLSVAKRVLLEEASDSLWQYDDPDSGVYDPPPPKDLMTRAQFAFRARDWEELLRQLAATEKKHVGQETGEKGDVPPSSDEKTPNMAHEDFLNCGLHLLMLFTQAYYKLLESAVGLPCHAADTELNQCYLWTIKNLRILLNKHPDLADFGVKFEPYLPNLLPTTTCDVDWADMAAPEADRLLGAVQEYVMDKGIRDPAEGSPAQVYIESYRPGVDNAIKVAMAYRKRMKKQFARLLKPAAKRAVKKKPATDANANKQPDPQPVPKPASVESVKSKEAGIPNLSGFLTSTYDPELEEARMASWSTVHRSDPTFVPRTLTVNDEAFSVELGPRMTRVFNMYLDPDDFLEICPDYGQLMDVEYVGEAKTLVVRLHCEAKPLPFPQRINLGAIPEKWENECGEYGRVEFDSGHYLPVRGYRFKDTTAADRSLICANRFQCGGQPQAAGTGDALSSQPSDCTPPARAEQQSPQGAPVGGTVAFPLQVGRFKVFDTDWSLVKFQNAAVTLSPELKKVYKAMHKLGAVSAQTAKTKKDILQAAGLPRNDRSLSNVLCPSGQKKDLYKSLYAACISKIEQQPPLYYLTQ